MKTGTNEEPQSKQEKNEQWLTSFIITKENYP